jgi:hypothetical protein
MHKSTKAGLVYLMVIDDKVTVAALAELTSIFLLLSFYQGIKQSYRLLVPLRAGRGRCPPMYRNHDVNQITIPCLHVPSPTRPCAHATSNSSADSNDKVPIPHFQRWLVLVCAKVIARLHSVP